MGGAVTAARRLSALLLILALLLLPVRADDGTLETAAAETAQYLVERVAEPTVSSVGGEWTVIGLARGGFAVPDGYFAGYRARLDAALQASDDVLSARKYTEYARVVLAVTALGQDARDVAGYDLTQPLGDYAAVMRQGLNGAVWALLALDAGDYPMPQDATATRQMYLDAILDAQRPGGGWSLQSGGADADVDLTAMALLALAPYRTQAAVSAAVDAALSYLSAAQQSNGGFVSEGTENAESAAQVLTALCTLGVGWNDPAFTKEDGTVLSALLRFRLESGAFSHTSGGAADMMATEQGLYALAAALRFRNGDTALFQVSGTSEKRFSDLDGTDCAAAVYALAAQGILDGMGDGRFAPEGGMTRAQFAAAVVRALDLTAETDGEFSDVAPEAWYAGYVNAAAAFGIAEGVGGGAFDPEGAVSRQAAAVMLTRAAAHCGLDTTCVDTQTRSSDASDASDWAQDALAFCQSAGILPDEALRPQSPATRSEVAQMLYALLGLIDADAAA
ncbi:MAG: S-layer homology domain-containing protein [Oscillospiraceae bacterium]|nr:S-layer homology domain-containing protein [Oscillospiraceae bacterium]